MSATRRLEDRMSTPTPDAARPIRQVSLNVWRCWRCGCIIARLYLLPGCMVEVKCAKCNALNTAAVGDKPAA